MTEKELNDYADILQAAALECKNIQDTPHSNIASFTPWANVGETEMVVALVSENTWNKLVAVRQDFVKTFGRYPAMITKEGLSGFWPNLNGTDDGYERNFLSKAASKRNWKVPKYISPIDGLDYILHILKPQGTNSAGGTSWHYPLVVGDVPDGKLIPVRIK